VGTGAAARRELEHLRTQRRDDSAVLRHAVLVELVEVAGERVKGLDVLMSNLGVADADAEQEAAGVGLVDAVKRLGDRLGRC
jgi:hypothetical protein